MLDQLCVLSCLSFFLRCFLFIDVSAAMLRFQFQEINAVLPFSLSKGSTHIDRKSQGFNGEIISDTSRHRKYMEGARRETESKFNSSAQRLPVITRRVRFWRETAKIENAFVQALSINSGK